MILHGDLFDVLPTLAARSVHCVVSSPPYWGLRDYGNPPRAFGGDPSCAHVWTESKHQAGGGQPGEKVRWQHTGAGPSGHPTVTTGFCTCGAWYGCLGLEPTPELFVEHIVQAFAEVHRVLRDDGTLWLNMGDCYATGAGAVGEHPGGGAQGAKWKGETRGYRGDNLVNTNSGTVARPKTSGARDARQPIPSHVGKHTGIVAMGPMTQPNRMKIPGYKSKDLVGVPWLLAFALRSAGWYLRAEIVWAKGVSFCDAYAGSVMPESVQDRPTRSHEQVFLLTKSPRYFYDAEAVREQGVYPAGTIAAKGSGEREGNRRGTRKKDELAGPSSSTRTQAGGFQDRVDAGYACYDGTRNLRTVWTISPKPFTEAHFATFPPDLVVPCIKAGTSEKGVCAVCGAPWRRLVEKEPIPDDVKADFEAARARTADEHGRDDGFTTRRPNFQRGRGPTTWEPTCEHPDAEIVPATVMDCFSGAGTVGAVCAGLQRRYVGVELNQEYIKISERRIAAVAPLFGEAANQ